MKLGFICLDLPGHLNPMSSLALQLQARNHEVVFLYSSGAAGLPFVRGPEKDHINESLPENEQKAGGGCIAINCSHGADSNGSYIEIIARNREGKRDRRADNRYSPVLCRIGCDAVGYAVCARFKLRAL